jgi:predicted nucleic acid-binding protein
VAEVRYFADIAKPPPGKLYLDTNVIIDLFEFDAAERLKDPQRPPGRLSKLADQLVTAAQRANARLIVTPLAVQEIFHCFSRGPMKALRDQRNCNDDKELRRKHPDEYEKCRKKVRANTRQALLVAKKRGVHMSMPVPGPNETAAAFGVRTLEKFQAIVDGCDTVGAADALHIVFGTFLGCDAFVSSDGDLQAVPGIVVYVPSK